MAVQASIQVPTVNEAVEIEFSSGQSVVLIGANGSGKTRLGAYIDRHFIRSDVETHRIAAHRSLVLNPNVIPPNLEVAENRLRFGRDDSRRNIKEVSRWGSNPETVLLNDFDHVVSALYAENTDVSVKFRQQVIENPESVSAVPSAKIDMLKSIWETLLPHRELSVLGGNIKTRIADNSDEYSASDMSDGERVIFYLIAQALLAKENTIVIFDEPELHINQSILHRLWDEIEGARPDCAFVYITHDIEFAASRHSSTKYALRSYSKLPTEAWDIELIPHGSALPSDVVATIIGSRKPVLFVEGDGGSLDSSLYRSVYESHTIIPVGSCERVIQTVNSFAAQPELHRIGCAGIVDSDARNSEEVEFLRSRKIHCLPVSEVENLILLPNVFLALAKALKFDDSASNEKLEAIKSFVMDSAQDQIESISVRHTKRIIDYKMKKVGLVEDDVKKLHEEFQNSTKNIDIISIYDDFKSKITSAVNEKNYESILLYYDNKGLVAEAAKILGYSKKSLDEFIGRALKSTDSSELRDALAECLPKLN